MNITHESMMSLTAQMPMREIVVNNELYLQRHFAAQLADGTQVWYHRFLRNDAERHLHSHPWRSKSTILVGSYTQERAVNACTIRESYWTGQINFIGYETTHRIVEVEPNTWTMMIVSPGRSSTWHFIEDDGTTTEMPTSSFEWSKEFKARGAA